MSYIRVNSLSQVFSFVSKMYYQLVGFCLLLAFNKIISGGHPKNLAWNGGPIHLKCEHGADLWSRSGKYVKENVIAIKAVSFKDEIYIITPRMKHGVLATVWLLIRERHGVELQPYPELRDHELFDCNGIQNAVDFYLDHLGHLWVLDSGIVDTIETPRCTCPPKVVMINLHHGKLTRRIDLSFVSEPTSLLQNVVVEYCFGKSYVYVSDATRGAVLVHDVSSGSQWSVLACTPALGLQLALVKRGLGHTVLILVRLHHQGLLELDTSALRRKKSDSPLTVFGDHTKPIIVLGSDAHRIYLRHAECSDVLSWDTRSDYNVSRLENIHSAGPRLITTSVAAYSLKHVLLVLDSNYADAIRGNLPTYHRITFIGQF